MEIWASSTSRNIYKLNLTIEFKSGSVNVHVDDPNSVSRMLLSKNDEVGSSIKYAKIKYGDQPGHIDDLVAETGQHITIEPFENGHRIRLRVYPIAKQ